MVERLGSFEIEGTLGEGGSAVVYAARDGDRQVALKVLRDDVGLDAREVDRFLAEADIMRKVQHKALVPVLRAGMLPGGRPYIAMPRLRGKTLAERLDAGPIPLARAMALFEDVAAALTLLHDSGLVHRDVKPENVFWLDGEDRLVLLDLGIARDTSGLPSTTTRAGMMRGTPAYMAPERFFGTSATIRSDVYELALLLYAMLTGALPWDEGDARGRIEPKPPSAHGVQVPVMLTQTLLDSLSLDMERRPASVPALLSRLREAASVAHAPTVLSPFTPPQPLATVARPYATTPSTPPTAAGPPATPQHHASAPPAYAGAPPQYASVPPQYASVPPQYASVPPQYASVPPQYASVSPQYASVSPQYAPQAHTPLGVSLPPEPKARSSGGLPLALGALIALAGVAGGAFIVRSLGKDDDSARTTRSASDDDPDEAAASEPTATASALAVALPASADAAPDRADGPAPSAASASGAPAGSQAGAPSASGARPSVSSPSASAGPIASAPASGTPTVIAPAGSLPASCQSFIALMCSPTSGSTPAECTTWKQTVQDWHTRYPPSVADSNCSAAFNASKNGLALRKASGPPPAPPPPAPSP